MKFIYRTEKSGQDKEKDIPGIRGKHSPWNRKFQESEGNIAHGIENFRNQRET
jgi:hypothetical protein